MPVKRKRDILENFDPNKSDSEDENFDPTEDRPRRPAKKAARPSRPKGPSRRRRRYNGSDVDDDDEVLSDSQQDDSFAEGDDDEDEVDAPVNAAGRRARKVTTRPQNYKEDSDEEEDIVGDTENDDDDVDIRPKRAQNKKQTKIVILKTSTTGRSTRNKGPVKEESLPPVGTAARRTRARTEDADEFVELTGSGKHAQPSRTSKSKSPEAMTRLTRNMRGGKGISKPPAQPTIDEATQESSQQPDQDEPGALVQTDIVEEDDVQEDADVHDADAEDELAGDGDVATKGTANEAAQEEPAADEDTDDRPIARRSTRSSRHSISAPGENAAEADDEGDKEPPTRSSGRLRQRSKPPSKGDQSSDFEPANDESAEEAPSEPSGKGAGDDEDEEYSSSRPSRGRRKITRKQQKRPREDSADDLDPDELADEAEELRRSSQSRTRPRRGAARRATSPPIAYEERNKRRRTAPVDYRIIKPLDQMVIEQDDEDPAPTPGRARKGRTAGGTIWERNFHATFGPFGGGSNYGALVGGPWGTGAAGAAADSDSSDDEMGQRSGAVGGAFGMTPTAAAPPGMFANPATAANIEAITGVSSGPNVGKVKNQKAFADADPLGVDMSVDFSKVGGLQGHIDQLKEMVQLPLLYPELFQRFKVTPPRGVLFHGPPGTGKTLLARALANSIGSGGRKITFYMRKGADALSKWVGEAEKQLRLLFEEARKTQPSIIFFDEIDGLAPVRSSKQEQIHASIVSTLLALMDGMDGRGQVIVIGATNRPDNIDPALRRPGRFDREFYFPLPDVDARKAILDIHTDAWGLEDAFKMSLAENTKGYGGADLRALCTEAALNSIQRTYPQIYSASEKLIVDPSKIKIHVTDFSISMKKMIPSSERSASSGAAPLPKAVEPLLRDQFAAIERTLQIILPRKKKITALEEALFEPYEDLDHGFEREKLQQNFERDRIFRPRLLITGLPGMGQGYLSSAVLHHFEGVHVQNFDLASLFADGRPLEQVIVGMFSEVKRHKPSVIFIPNIEAWSAGLGGNAVAAFKTMLNSIPPTDPVLLLGTAESEMDQIDKALLRGLFDISRKNMTKIERPNRENREQYFTNVVSLIRKKPTEFPDPSNRKKRVLEELAVAPPPPPKPQTKAEMKAEAKRDRQMLNILKIKLQPIMDQIKKKYKSFIKPPIPWDKIGYLWQEADPAFVRADLANAEGPARPFEHAQDKDGSPGIRDVETGKFWYNLDIVTIEERLSNGYYARPIDFYKDIKALVHDAKNSGDREKILKANELESNVDVDVADAEANVGGPEIWEALYQRQKARAEQAAEKAKKRAEQARASGLVLGDVPDDEVGPIRIGVPVPPPEHTTDARFRPMTPEPNPEPNGQSSHHLTNGDSTPSRRVPGAGAVDEDTQPFSQMGPPPQAQWPRMQETGPLGESARATMGGATQISQVSAITSLPPGVSPSAVLNDASTTKTSGASTQRSSLKWSTQATNGVHTDPVEHSNSQFPDTQLMDSHSGPSQESASNHPWPHSQAQAMQQGELNPPTPSAGFPGYNVQMSPTSSQIPPGRLASKSHAPSVQDLLNDDTSSSVRNSGQSAGSSQQLTVIHEGEVRNFLSNLTDRTSGCTIEQLEQINRELMDEVWHTRHEWNRMKVLSQLRKVFNDTISDIDIMQELGLSSQERATELAQAYGE